MARARELLRSRLVRRGLTLSSAGVVVILAQSTVAVAVSPSLLNNTVKAALAFSGGNGAGAAVSASAVKLADGMVSGIALAKIKMMAAVVLGASVLGVGAVTHGAPVGQVNDRPRDQATIRPNSPEEKPRAISEQPASQEPPRRIRGASGRIRQGA